ncbi:hypothetical protein JW777_06265 [bacterium]|nr:hypothetical protein [bacterium]
MILIRHRNSTTPFSAGTLLRAAFKLPVPVWAALLIHATGPSIPFCGASVLSSGGVGYPAGFAGARYAGMGGVSISLADPSSAGSWNPASLAEIRLTRLDIEYLYENNTFRDASGSSRSPYSNFNGFTLALPFGRGLSAAFGLSPCTRADYRIAYPDSLAGETFNKSVEASGGLNSADAAFAFRIRHWADFGLKAHYFFGKLDETWRIVFNGTGFTGTTDLLSSRMKGFSFTAGCIVHPLRVLSLGAVYRPGFDVDTEVERYADPLSGFPALHTGTITMPTAWGIGVHGILPKGLLAAAEYSTEAWSRMTINGRSAPHLADAERLAFGLEWLPGLLPTDGFFRRTAYRAGFSVGRFYRTDAENGPVREITATLGAGLPLGNAASRMDASVAIGRRGGLSDNSFEEDFVRVSVSASLAEKWFTRK